VGCAEVMNRARGSHLWYSSTINIWVVVGKPFINIMDGKLCSQKSIKMSSLKQDNFLHESVTRGKVEHYSYGNFCRTSQHLAWEANKVLCKSVVLRVSYQLECSDYLVLALFSVVTAVR
jgi:hypothetical protein